MFVKPFKITVGMKIAEQYMQQLRKEKKKRNFPQQQKKCYCCKGKNHNIN